MTNMKAIVMLGNSYSATDYLLQGVDQSKGTEHNVVDKTEVATQLQQQIQKQVLILDRVEIFEQRLKECATGWAVTDTLVRSSL